MMEDTSSWRHYRFLSHNDVVGFATVDKNDIVQRQYSITRASQALVAAGPHTTMYYLIGNLKPEQYEGSDYANQVSSFSSVIFYLVSLVPHLPYIDPLEICLLILILYLSACSRTPTT